MTKINNFLAAEDFERARGERVLSPAHSEPTLGVMARLIPEKGVVELIEELADPAAAPGLAGPGGRRRAAGRRLRGARGRGGSRSSAWPTASA